VIADLTWGSGQTQTTLGTVNAIQGVGGALSGIFGGFVVHAIGWTGGFVVLAVPALAAFALSIWLEEAAQ
jgi:predicted MFS family arabinose efflux permease